MLIYRKDSAGNVLEEIEAQAWTPERVTYIAGGTRVQRYCDVEAGESFTDVAASDAKASLVERLDALETDMRTAKAKQVITDNTLEIHEGALVEVAQIVYE